MKLLVYYNPESDVSSPFAAYMHGPDVSICQRGRPILVVMKPVAFLWQFLPPVCKVLVKHILVGKCFSRGRFSPESIVFGSIWRDDQYAAVKVRFDFPGPRCDWIPYGAHGRCAHVGAPIHRGFDDDVEVVVSNFVEWEFPEHEFVVKVSVSGMARPDRAAAVEFAKDGGPFGIWNGGERVAVSNDDDRGRLAAHHSAPRGDVCMGVPPSAHKQSGHHEHSNRVSAGKPVGQ